ncbi:MAG: CsiV family protein, partial [Nevskiales bacterium]
VQQSAGLRVRLDLGYTIPASAAPAEYANGSSMTISAAELATFSLHAEKRVNLGQTHFFDHPVLGVLLRVSAMN